MNRQQVTRRIDMAKVFASSSFPRHLFSVQEKLFDE